MEFSGLSTHYRIFAQIRAYTECTTQNMTLAVSLDGGATTSSTTLTAWIDQVIETTPINHNSSNLILIIQFGTQG